MNIFKSKKELVRFVKFGLVGILGSVVDFGVFNLLTLLTAIPAVAASAISFTLAVINNFIFNRFWTYPETRQENVYKQLVQFAVVSCLGLAIRLPLFAFLEKQLIPLSANWFPNLLTPTIVGHNLALAIVIGVVMLWNYFINRLWTFRSVPA